MSPAGPWTLRAQATALLKDAIGSLRSARRQARHGDAPHADMAEMYRKSAAGKWLARETLIEAQRERALLLKTCERFAANGRVPGVRIEP